MAALLRALSMSIDNEGDGFSLSTVACFRNEDDGEIHPLDR